MNTSILSSWQRGLLATAAVVAALVGCGGGVGEGGTGGGFAQGSISGFGSIIVNDVHFDETNATVLDVDGNQKTKDDLRLGMTVDIDSGAITSNSSGSSATASRIQYASEIVGALTAVDAGNARLQLLGQTVMVDSTTVFADDLVGGLAALAVNQRIQVYGFLDTSTGFYRATRIDSPSSADPFRLRGIVSQLDVAARTLRIGAAQFSYSGVAPAEVVNGAFVRLKIQPAPAATAVWTVLAFGSGTAVPRDGLDCKIKGLITAFQSKDAFSVNGQPVVTSGAQFPNGVPTGVGVRVEVEGRVQAGVLQATKVTIRTDSQEGQGFELDGLIANLDTSAKTFQIRNVTVSYAGTVQYDGGGSEAALRNNLKVEVRGLLSSDGTALQAQRIKFD